MCIIAYFEKDLELNETELKECFTNNPDGAGLMYYDQDKNLIHIRKGFMDFKDFWKVASTLPQDIDRVFHFRIATSGKVGGGCCHPFPVTNDYNIMRRINSFCEVGMVHNGIMSEFTPAGGMKATHSDTMQFVKEIVYELDGGLGVFNIGVKNLINLAMHTNKYIFLKKDGVSVIGDFVQSEISGALYSNSTYKESRYIYTPINYNYDGQDSIYPYTESEAWYDYDTTVLRIVAPHNRDITDADILAVERDFDDRKIDIISLISDKKYIEIEVNYMKGKAGVIGDLTWFKLTGDLYEDSASKNKTTTNKKNKGLTSISKAGGTLITKK